jgi:hypothetical protein
LSGRIADVKRIHGEDLQTGKPTTDWKGSRVVKMKIASRFFRYDKLAVFSDG